MVRSGRESASDSLRTTVTTKSKNLETLLWAIQLGWIILLFPWLAFAPLSGMAFDAGDTPAVRAFLWSVWTYPLSVLAAGILRKRLPLVVLLPLANVICARIADNHVVGR